MKETATATATSMGSTSSMYVLHFADSQTINGLNNVKQLASGGGHTIALTEEGFLFGWGKNECGQLGLGHCVNIPQQEPQPIQGLCNVVEIVAKYKHTLALTQDGKVWTWGKGSDVWATEDGKLCKVSPTVPGEIEGLKHVGQYIKRREDAFALTHKGRVSAWAWEVDKGQLDLRKHTSIQELLKHLKISAQIGGKAPYPSNDNGDANECSLSCSAATLFPSEKEPSASVALDPKSIKGSSSN